VRAAEIYNNSYFATRQVTGGQCRGGTMLLHDNTYDGKYLDSITPVVTRLFENAGGAGTGNLWAGADGTNAWDLNATEPDGTHVDGHAPYTFATDTHIGPNVPSKRTEIVTVSGNPWTPDQWAGYTITNTNSASQYYLGHGYISSNTASTLAVTSIVEMDHPPTLGFNTGDTFAIHKVLRVIDQPGSGPGELIVGNPPGSTKLAGTSWPHYPNQSLEPLYSWNNTLNSVNVNFGHTDASDNLRENIDFYNNTAMPGYTPYTYPHPLVSSIPTPTPTPTAFVTSENPGTLRNDLSGWFGMAITVGPNPITINSLGRLVAPSNSQVHTLKIVDASAGTDIASSSVDAIQGAVGTFIYGNLASPITLSANASYYVLSGEASGGDQWYDSDTMVTTTSDAALDGAVSGAFAPYAFASDRNQEYVPLDFTYSVQTTPIPTPTPTPTPTPLIQVTVQTSSAGRSFTVDGIDYNATQSFSWDPGSSHTIATTLPQSGGTGVQYVWKSWSDGGSISHTVAPTTNKTYTATFTTQYYLTMSAGTGGTVTPASGWKNSGVAVSITAKPAITSTFSNWTGSGIGSYSGANNPASITMVGPITEVAAFTQNPVQVMVQTSPAGRSFTVDGIDYNATQGFSWDPGSSHTIATSSPQSDGTGVQYVWKSWSDGGSISHTVTPTSNKTYTANFTTQYYLSMVAGTGGKVSPSSGWKNSGAVLSITATPLTGYIFSNWSGSGTGSYSGSANPSSIMMNGPISESATFTH
jgi:hypothetical protein